MNATPTRSRAATGKTVLIVDDMPENLQVIGSLLQPHYRVLVADHGASALRVARTKPHPDLILLDIMMPGMDGYEVLRQLRENPDSADIPVIFVTAMDSDADEARGLALGAVDYITKPVIPALLLARVRTQLELKDAHDWLRDRNAVLAAEVARQVAEIKAAKEAAEAASRSKSVFIDSMSHEIRTPMHGVIGMLQLARDELPADHAAQEFIQVALDSARSMVDLLREILEYARIAHDAITLREQPMSVKDLFDYLTFAWREPIERKGIAFVVTLTPGTPEELVGDENHLKHVLALLLDNACKFTATGTIELGVEGHPGSVHFWVRDTGIGIKEQDREKVFKAFEQVDTAHNRKYGGAGLGLAIAHRLIELMGGALWVEIPPGNGSTFHITLPLDK